MVLKKIAQCFPSGIMQFLNQHTSKYQNAQNILYVLDFQVCPLCHPTTSPVTVYVVTPPAASTLLCCYRDVPWVMDSHWIIASVLLITCARCFPYSRDMRWQRRRAPLKKKWRRRENASLTRIGGAWIANLPDNGKAQCNLRATDLSISCGGRTDVRRHQESARHAKLAKSKGLYQGWVVQ